MTLQEELEWTKAQLEEYRALFQMHVDAVRVANAYVEVAKAEQKQLKTMKKQFDLAMALVDKLKAETAELTKNATEMVQTIFGKQEHE